MQLSFDQEEALDTTVDSIDKRRETVLVGPAGSGKTTLMRILVERMRKKRRVVQACPTGKAAQRLTELTGKHASTIHKLLYREVEDVGNELFFGDPKAPCRNGELLVVDESSMVGRHIYNELMKYLPRDSRVLWVGDAEQLEPVKDTWGPNLKRPTARLTEVHRQALNNPIIAYATAVRQDRGDAWLKENWNPEDDRIAIAKGAFPAMRWYLDSLEREADSTYITFTHRVRRAFNESVRENRKVASTRLAPGDRILVKTNRHQAGLMNGQVLTVKSLTRLSRNYRNDEVYRVAVKEREQSLYINLDLIEKHPRDFWSWYKALPEWKQDYRLTHIWYGNCLTVHCVHPDTLVETEMGLLPIRQIAQSGAVATPEGPKPYKNLVVNPVAPAFRVETEGGYSLTMTPEHGMDAWSAEEGKYIRVEAANLRPGDWLRMKLSPTIEPSWPCPLPGPPWSDSRAHKCRLPMEVTQQFARFLGMFVADGTLFQRGFRLVKQHRDVVDHFRQLVEELFRIEATTEKCTDAHYEGDVWKVEVNSTYLASWLRGLGGLGAGGKAVPACVLRSPSHYQGSFLCGLMIDGSVHVKNGFLDHIELCQRQTALIETVRVMLLRLGIVVGKVRASKGRVKYDNIAIYGPFATRFVERVGLLTEFHQKRATSTQQRKGASRYRVPVSREQTTALYKAGHFTTHDKYNTWDKGYTSRAKAEGAASLEEALGWHHERIVSIEPVECMSMCIEVPNGHRFLQNGISGWNSAQGSQWDEVGFLWGDSFRRMRRRRTEKESARRFLYTAVTRSAEKLSIFSL